MDMDKLTLKIKEFIFDTCVLIADSFKGTNGIVAGALAVLFYIALMRTWTLKKTLSFFFTIFILFIGLIRLEAFLKFSLGAENADIPIGITRVVFLALAAVAYFYQAAVKE